MSVCCAAAAGCAVGFGAYLIIAGAAVAITTVVALALKALSQLPSFSESKQLKACMTAIENCKTNIQSHIQGLIDKIRRLFPPSPCCCTGKKSPP